MLSVQHADKHDLDVYVKEGADVPSRWNGGYDYKDIHASPNISITGPVATTVTTFTAGVFGFKGSKVAYTVQLHLASGKACPDDCNHRGACNSGVCQCKPGYGGAACETAVTTIELNRPYTSTVGSSAWVRCSLLMLVSRY